MVTENNSYRIRTGVGNGSPNVLKVKLDQTYDTIDVLSLSLEQKNIYKRFQSDYGVIVGRVLANDGFGIPNAKVSVFLPLDDDASTIEQMLYPFSSTTDKDSDGVKYNLLPEYVDDVCHQNVGTFPTKRTVLDNDNIIEVFDKYYKFTTTTNSAGDYMIFGVPTGTCNIHVDIDLSDIGVLSQRPRDMVYKGYDINLFESPNKFRDDTNLNYLSQIKSQDTSVFVYPYWGDTSDETDEIAISRCDINIDYKFEPTCIFMGSIISDSGSNAFGKYCKAPDHIGEMSTLIAGEGSIEMIRKTFDGKVEEFPIKGNRVIDSDGVWCYQIPMNLDYMVTDEFGNMVPSDNPERGIPTRARVRFRISMDDAVNDSTARKRCRYLVPNNPRLDEERYPDFNSTHEVDYEFGSRTKEENYRDLLWNKVYTVKNYIPRLQKHTHLDHKTYSGIKLINDYGDNNPMPFNNVSIRLGFSYQFSCVISKIVIDLVMLINNTLTQISMFFCVLRSIIRGLHSIKIFGFRVFGLLTSPLIKIIEKVIPSCVGISSDICGGETTHAYTFYPGCGNFFGKSLHQKLDDKDLGCIRSITKRRHDDNQKKLNPEDRSEYTESDAELRNCIETSLANDNDAILFNFGNDWVNGSLYMPMWFRKITKKRKYFFGLFGKKRAYDDWCSADVQFSHFYGIQPCAVKRSNGESYTDMNGNIRQPKILSNDEKCNQCHKNAKSFFGFNTGIVVQRETMLGETVYYYKSVEYDTQSNINNTNAPVNETGKDGSVKLMFATDIVLLGSLNDCDPQGVPQFFKSLEGTTYNMPPLLLYTDNVFETVYKKDNDGNVTVEYKLEQTSATEKTGCDWSNTNDDICHSDDGGLFYDIGCSATHSKPKSCINLQRICEYGVSLDESKKILAKTMSDNMETEEDLYATLVADGFVSKDEINDESGRTVFATLNGNNLKTRTNEENGMAEYEFIHLIADNFDGSLYTNMREHQQSCMKTQKYNYMLEKFSQGYYDFRMGKTPYFYNTKDDNNFKFPRYENSFYFYFGLKSGKTAIDKFNSQFFSECKSSDDSASLIGVLTKGDDWCTETGGYIALDLSKVEKPCNLMFMSSTIDTDTNERATYSFPAINDDYVYFSEDAFGYMAIGNSQNTISYDAYMALSVDNKKKYICVENKLDGYVHIQTNDLKNGKWMLSVTDAMGNVIDVDVNKNGIYLNSDVSSLNFELSDKELIEQFQKRDVIAEEGGNINGSTSNLRRDIGGTICVSFPLNGETSEELDEFVINVYMTNYITNYNIEFKKVNDTYTKKGCVYDVTYSNNNVKCILNTEANYKVGKKVLFGLPKCKEYYTITVTQLCDGVESGNVLTRTVFIDERESLKLYINGIVDYDTIKDWECGFDISVNGKQVSIFRNENDVSSEWYRLADPSIYKWSMLNSISDIDKQTCEALSLQSDYVKLFNMTEFNIYNIIIDYIKNGRIGCVTFEELKQTVVGEPSVDGDVIYYEEKDYFIDSDGNVWTSSNIPQGSHVTLIEGIIHDKLSYFSDLLDDDRGKIIDITNTPKSTYDFESFTNMLKVAVQQESNEFSNYKKNKIKVKNDGQPESNILSFIIHDKNPNNVDVYNGTTLVAPNYDNSDESLFSAVFVNNSTKEELTYEEYIALGEDTKEIYDAAYIQESSIFYMNDDIAPCKTFDRLFINVKYENGTGQEIGGDYISGYGLDFEFIGEEYLTIPQYDEIEDNGIKSLYAPDSYLIDGDLGLLPQLNYYINEDVFSSLTDSYKTGYNNNVSYFPNKKVYDYEIFQDENVSSERLMHGKLETTLMYTPESGYVSVIILTDETDESTFSYSSNVVYYIHTDKIVNNTLYEIKNMNNALIGYVRLTYSKTVMDLLDERKNLKGITTAIDVYSSVADLPAHGNDGDVYITDLGNHIAYEWSSEDNTWIIDGEPLTQYYTKYHILALDEFLDERYIELYEKNLKYRNIYTNVVISKEELDGLVEKDGIEQSLSYVEFYTLSAELNDEEYNQLVYTKELYDFEGYGIRDNLLVIDYDTYFSISEDSDSVRSLYESKKIQYNGYYTQYRSAYINIEDPDNIICDETYETLPDESNPSQGIIGKDFYSNGYICSNTPITKTRYNGLPDSFKPQFKLCYVNKEYTNKFITETVYDSLSNDLKSKYEEAYINKNNSNDVIGKTLYDKMTDGYKDDYEFKTTITLTNITNAFDTLLGISEYLGEIDPIKKEYILNVRNTFQITNEIEGNTIFYTVKGDENDLPVTYHNVYMGETDANGYDLNNKDGVGFIDYDKNIVEGKYTYTNNNYTTQITIPTITNNNYFIIDESFSAARDSYKIGDTGYYFARDPYYKAKKSTRLNSDAYAKKAYFIAVNNILKDRKIPLDFDVNDNATKNYFGFHIIDRYFKFEGVAWSFPLKDVDQYTAKGKSFITGKIINGAADYTNTNGTDFRLTKFQSMTIGEDDANDGNSTIRIITDCPLPTSSDTDSINKAKINAENNQAKRFLCQTVKNKNNKYKLTGYDNYRTSYPKYNEYYEIENRTVELNVIDYMGNSLSKTFDGGMTVNVSEESIIYQGYKDDEWVMLGCDTSDGDQSDNEAGYTTKLKLTVSNSSSDRFIYYLFNYCDTSTDGTNGIYFPQEMATDRNNGNRGSKMLEDNFEFNLVKSTGGDDYPFMIIAGYAGNYFNNKNFWIVSTLMTDNQTIFSQDDINITPAGYFYNDNENGKYYFKGANVGDTGEFYVWHNKQHPNNGYVFFCVADNMEGTRTFSQHFNFKVLNIKATLSSDGKTLTFDVWEQKDVNPEHYVYLDLMYGMCSDLRIGRYDTNVINKQLTKKDPDTQYYHAKFELELDRVYTQSEIIPNGELIFTEASGLRHCFVFRDNNESLFTP